MTFLGSLAREWSRLEQARVTWTSVLALSYLSVFGSFIAFAAFVWLLQRVSPALISTYAFVNPVVAVFLGWLVLSEPIHGRILLATALIVGAVAAIQVSRFRKTLFRDGRPMSLAKDDGRGPPGAPAPDFEKNRGV